MPSAAALTIEDRISDPMMPELDPSLLDFRPLDVDLGSRKEDPLNWNSQLLSDPMNIEIGRHAPMQDQRAEFDEEDMNIDLNLDIGLDEGPSVQLGRRRAPSWASHKDPIGGNYKPPDDLNLETRTHSSSQVPSLIADDDGRIVDDDNRMLLDEDDGFQLPMDNLDVPRNAPADPRLQRDSQSPLSSVRSSIARGFEATNLHQKEEEAPRQATHKAKKRKVLQADADTMLSSNFIKQQQANRSAILKPATFLSRDPILLNLMNMQKNGDFVSGVMGDQRAKGWAPELKGILSIEMVRKSGERKRKREKGVVDVDENKANPDTVRIPQLEIPDEEIFGTTNGRDTTAVAVADRARSETHPPADDGLLLIHDSGGIAEYEDGKEDMEPGIDQFDETTAPLLHPSEQGLLSQGTKHAVHLLRECFGSSAEGGPPQQKKAHIMFQDLLPERRTSKLDATKMFFEVLVLATKDAVKVEQASKEVGSAIKIRAKRGLWGVWAESEAGGQIAGEDDMGPSLAASY